jgi:hypothetical protein
MVEGINKDHHLVQTIINQLNDIEVDGEPIEASRKNNYSVAYDEKNPFSPKEIIYFLDHYEEIVGRRY